MQNNSLKSIKSLTVSFWMLIWMFAVLYAAFFILKDRNFSVQTLLMFIILILGHIVFFIDIRLQYVRHFFLLIQLAGIALFLNSIWMINAEGTTWGSGPAGIGLALLVPSLNTFFSAAKSRQDKKLGWYISAAGIIGIFITLWRMNEVQEQLNAGLEFWAPVRLYQNVGIIFSVLLVLTGAATLLRKRQHN